MDEKFQPLNDHVQFRVQDNELTLTMPLTVRGQSKSGKTNTIVNCHEKIPGTNYTVGLNINSLKDT